ncbi:phage tail assembly chaperone [Trinickia sp. LjRoot230]|uniref:phage tail assembly chaperone n=1 Tax=Trinickia sp. LjRoot230 TaxID=3342288 RepID=UPI003ECDA71E
MNVYHYDPSTGEYVGQSTADASPLEPDVHLVPACATEVAPPACASGSIAVFHDGEWSVVDDHRGKTFWRPDGTQMAMQTLGPLPADALIEAPKPTPEKVASAQRGARDAVLAATDWIVTRHQDELLIGHGTTLDQGQIDTLLTYRQALRDLPTAEHWPYVDLPVLPDFVVAANSR